MGSDEALDIQVKSNCLSVYLAQLHFETSVIADMSGNIFAFLCHDIWI